MNELEKIAEELKDFIGEEVLSVDDNVGKARLWLSFKGILYEVKENKDGKIIIDFNNHFGEETNVYKKAKKFSQGNNYILNPREYNLIFPIFDKLAFLNEYKIGWSLR